MTLKRPYAPTPFWFLNDRLDSREILRQIAAMDDAGVGGFVLHPRVGLPRDQAWMSDALMGFMKLAVEEAARRGLRVVLYDEGMYPSGSSCGLVVKENAGYQCRGWECRASDTLGAGETLVARCLRANGEVVFVIDRPVPSVIRGLHYTLPDDGGAGSPAGDAEETPPAADLLNEKAMATFLRLTHDRYASVLRSFFGSTITGIFTDEPSLLGRPTWKTPKIVAGTTGLLPHLERLTGTDFTPLLPALFFDDEPDAKEVRHAYEQAVRRRLEETYYAPMAAWCERHGLELMGHPEKPDDLAIQKHFGVPGQDLVWRWVLPGSTATRGAQSTQCKSAASAAYHLGRHRNSNEFAGAYGHQLTFDELLWLANHCLVRGQNWLIPHAYYYSMRGPRCDERPPDVGFNSKWAEQVPAFNDYCDRLSELVANSEPVVRAALIATGDNAPDRAAESLFQHQIDFHYVEDVSLASGDQTSPRIAIRGTEATYDVIVYDGVGDAPSSIRSHPTFVDATHEGWLDKVHALTSRTLTITPSAHDLRVRRMRREGREVVLAFNEGSEAISFEADGVARATDPWDGRETLGSAITIEPGRALLLE